MCVPDSEGFDAEVSILCKAEIHTWRIGFHPGGDKISIDLVIFYPNELKAGGVLKINKMQLLRTSKAGFLGPESEPEVLIALKVLLLIAVSEDILNGKRIHRLFL